MSGEPMLDWEDDQIIRVRAAYHHAMLAAGMDLLACLQAEDFADRYRSDRYREGNIISTSVLSLPGEQ